MIACMCGFSTATEGELMSHILECHRLSYALEVCTLIEPTSTPEPDRVMSERPSAA